MMLLAIILDGYVAILPSMVMMKGESESYHKGDVR